MKSVLLKTSFVFLLIISLIALNGCKACKDRRAKKEEAKRLEAECQTKCGLKPDAGLCKAYFPKYYYDKEEGKCKEFIWGGCDGVVPFQTLEECEKCDCKNKLSTK